MICQFCCSKLFNDFFIILIFNFLNNLLVFNEYLFEKNMSNSSPIEGTELLYKNAEKNMSRRHA